MSYLNVRYCTFVYALSYFKRLIEGIPTMGRNAHSTLQQRLDFKRLSAAGYSQQKIAEILGRSKIFLFNALHSTGTKTSTGRTQDNRLGWYSDYAIVQGRSFQVGQGN